MKYSFLIVEKYNDDEVTIKTKDLNEFLDRTYEIAYKDGYAEGYNAGAKNDYPYKVIPTWGDKTAPDYLHKITCDSATTGISMKLERDPENPFHIIGAHSV